MGVYAAYISQYLLNGVSILCSMVTVVIVMWVWKKYPASKESPSFSLTPWIALADLPMRIVGLISIPLNYPDGVRTSPSTIRFLAWFNFFGISWFICLTCMITLDLQLVFFHHLPRHARIRRWYPTIGFIMAFLVTVPYFCLPIAHPFTMGSLHTGISTLTNSRLLFLWTTIWMLVGISYSLAVALTVFTKVFRAHRQVIKLSTVGGDRTMSCALIRNAYLILAYPVVLIIIYIPYSVVSWLRDSTSTLEDSPWFWIESSLFASQGLFSMAIMLFHPVMLHTYQKYNVNIHTFWVSLTHLKWFSGSTTFGTSFSDTLGTHSHTDISNSAANDIKIGGGKGNILASLDHRIPMGTETEFSGILNCHFRESSSQAISSELKLDGLDGIKALEPDNLEHDGQVTSYHGFDDPVCL